MLLSELFSYITTLDSANTNIGEDDGNLAGKHYTKVVNAINLGLIEMYSQFPIEERSLIIQLYAHITNYRLHPDFAQTNTTSAEVYKYIQDSSSNPFVRNDVSKITYVSNEIGTELPINTNSDDTSVYTPAYNILHHPYPSDSNAVTVSYRALPKTVPASADPDTYEVALPAQILNLFLVYVNHKLLASINSQESAAKLKEYLGLLALAKTTGLFMQDNFSNQKIEVNGWE